MATTRKTAAKETDAPAKPDVEVVDGIEVVDETEGAAAPAPKGAKAGPKKSRKTKSGKKATKKAATDTGPRSPEGTAQKPKAAPPPPVSNITVAQLADSYLHHLEAMGKSETTVRSYRGDLGLAIRELGGDTKVASLTPDRVLAYFESDAVTKKRDGKPRNQITIDKVRRVFRLALTWLVEVGVIEKAPVPERDELASASKS